MAKMFNDQGEMERLKARVAAAKARMPDAVSAVHDHSSKHREEILSSEACGCFYCGETFLSAEIEEWVDDEQTALCPRCGIDSVIGSVSGFPMTKEFLAEMNRYWF
jgi:hypothetical protein